MCWRQRGYTGRYEKIMPAVNVNGILERQWSKKHFAMKQKKQRFTYLCHKAKADEGSEAAVTAKTRFGRTKIKKS